MSETAPAQTDRGAQSAADPEDQQIQPDERAEDSAQVEELAEESVDVSPEPVAETRTFADFGVRQDIADALAEAGIVHPFPIQSMTLPIALSGQDIIGQAMTGTG